MIFFFLLNNEIRKKITGSENPRKCWLSNYLIADNYFIFHDTIECEGNFRSHLASPAQSSLIALVHLPQVAFFFSLNLPFAFLPLVCCCLVTWSCWTLWSMECFSVLCFLQAFAQTHVHCGRDAIQPSHPLCFPSSPALNLSQHQSLFHFSYASI